MEDWLANKKLVIIGGTAGIGLSAAIACIKEGAKVIAVGRNAEHVIEAKKKFGDNGFAIEADATNETTAEKAIQICAERFGGFDGLYHVAGGSGRKFGDGRGYGPFFEETRQVRRLRRRARVRRQ